MTVLLARRTQTATGTLSNVSVTGAPGNQQCSGQLSRRYELYGQHLHPGWLSFPVALSTPTITSLTPNSAYVGSGATTVTINGTDFLSGAAVKVTGTSQTATFVSARPS